MSTATKEPRQALCVTRNAALRRTIRRTLNAAGTAVEFVEELDSGVPTNAAIVIVDRDSRGDSSEALIQIAGPEGKVIVVGGSLEDDEIIELLRLRPTDHLITDLDAGDERELLVTSVKLLSGDIFGLDKYLAWGVSIYEEPIQSYEEKRAVITQVADYARAVGARRPLVGRIESVVDELLMNALYDAPSIRYGVSRQRRVARSAGEALPAEEVATLRYAADGRYFAVSVRDNFGELHKDAILDNLSRARAERGHPLGSRKNGSGGAGLGLYFIISAATRFIANIDPGRRTEVICLFDLRQSGREANTCAQSLHIFHT